MAQRKFDDFLENGSLPDDAREQELAALLAEVEALDEPDPGAAYWHQFNGRLKTRLAKAPARKKRFAKMPLWAGLAAAAVLLIVLVPPGAEPQQQGLDQLSVADLVLIDEAFPLVEEESSVDLADSDLEVILESLDTSETELFDDLISMEPEELKSLWEREG